MNALVAAAAAFHSLLEIDLNGNSSSLQYHTNTIAEILECWNLGSSNNAVRNLDRIKCDV
eukprot:SAG25_NODE_1399_length_3116_cov_4.903547_2_plen_60_part_00